MALGVCVDCGVRLSLGRRLLRHDRCAGCQAKHDERVAAELKRKEAEHNASLSAYRAALSQLRLGADLSVVLPRIAEAAHAAALDRTEIKALNEQTFARYLDETLADDVITREEDAMIAAVAQQLHVTYTAEQWARAVVASANTGILPRVARSNIMLNAGEDSYLELKVRLLTKRVITERRTNYNSVSFPVGHSGVRYRVGQSRGRTVVVGTRTEIEDAGLLAVTSQRVVFAGEKKTLEFRYGRLVGLRLFGDGLGLQIANRQSIPTFQTGAGNVDVIAAILNATVGYSRGTFQPARVAPVRRLVTPPPVQLPLRASTPEAEASLPTGSAHPNGDASVTEPQQPAPAADSGHGESEDSIVPPAPSPAPAADREDDEHVHQLMLELAKVPGLDEQLTMISSAYQLGIGTSAELESLLDRVIQGYASMNLAPPIGPLPPAITPHPPGTRIQEPGPPIRDTTANFEGALGQLRAEGLAERHIVDLRADYCHGLIEEQQLLGVEMLLKAMMSPQDRSTPQAAVDEARETAGGSGETDAFRDSQSRPDVAYYLLNTNYSNDQQDDADMLADGKAAAFFDPWKTQDRAAGEGRLCLPVPKWHRHRRVRTGVRRASDPRLPWRPRRRRRRVRDAPRPISSAGGSNERSHDQRGRQAQCLVSPNHDHTRPGNRPTTQPSSRGADERRGELIARGVPG